MENEVFGFNDREPEREEKRGPEKKKEDIKISVSERLLLSSFAIASVVLFAIYAIVRNFGVNNAILRGVMSIFVYGLALAGAIVSIFRNGKPTIEFWLSIGALYFAFRFF